MYIYTVCVYVYVWIFIWLTSECSIPTFFLLSARRPKRSGLRSFKGQGKIYFNPMFCILRAGQRGLFRDNGKPISTLCSVFCAQVKEVRTQILDICKQLKMPVTACGYDLDQVHEYRRVSLYIEFLYIYRD